MSSRIPVSCADLDLALVERVLTKHYGDIARAAKELGVPGPDLRRLTWARPKLLEAANEACELFVERAWGVMIDALDSDDPRRRMWAADKIMSSWAARDSPFAPARRSGPPPAAAAGVKVSFRWVGAPPNED